MSTERERKRPREGGREEKSIIFGYAFTQKLEWSPRIDYIPFVLFSFLSSSFSFFSQFTCFVWIVDCGTNVFGEISCLVCAYLFEFLSVFFLCLRSILVSVAISLEELYTFLRWQEPMPTKTNQEIREKQNEKDEIKLSIFRMTFECLHTQTLRSTTHFIGCTFTLWFEHLNWFGAS